jgi:PAS domain S-box-containing protein
MNFRRFEFAFRIAAIYAIFGGLWILFSDLIVALLVKTPEELTRAQTYKGWGFVVVSALLIFVLVRRETEGRRFIRLAQDQLEQSETKFKVMFENMTEGVMLYEIMYDKNGQASDYRVLDINPAYEKHMGISSPQAIGKPSREIYTTKTSPFLEEFIQIVKIGQSYSFETYYKKKYLDISIIALASGQFAAIFTDITENKKYEEALRASQQESAFLADLIERSSQALGVGFPDGSLGKVNQAFLNLTGYTREEIEQLDWSADLTPPEWREIETKNIERMLQTRKPVRYEKEYIRKDGTRIPVELFTDFSEDEQGQVEYYYSFVTNITERRTALEKLAKSEEKFKSLFEAMTEGVALHEIIYDEQGKPVNYRILNVNPAYEKHTGVSSSEAIGKLGNELYGTETAPYLDEFTKKFPYQFETYFPPMERYFNISVTSPATGQFATIFTDITERKKIQEALRASQQQWEATFNSMTDWVSLIDFETHRVLRTNRAGETLFGLPLDEIVKKKCHELVHLTNQPIPGCPLEKARQTRQRETMEFFDEVRGCWLLITVDPILSEKDQKPVQAVHIVSDITERKMAEAEREALLQESQNHLRRLEALHAVDLAISASMDLRTTLNILLNQVTSQLQVDAADVLLLGSESQTFNFAAGYGFRTDTLEKAHSRVGNSLAGQCVIERKVVQFSDVSGLQLDPTFLSLWEKESFQEYVGIPLISKGQVKGVLEILHRSHLKPEADWLQFLETLSQQAAIAIDNAQLYDTSQRFSAELAFAYDATIESWARSLELHDGESKGHSQRTVRLTLKIARFMNVREDQFIHIRRGVLLHDIGKVGIPTHILTKPSKLTKKEWEIVKKHPETAAQILSGIEFLVKAIDIPRYHHEKWDGNGYPNGLSGEQIPLPARIFAIVDVWDALLNDRPYRKAWSSTQALDYIRSQSGQHFDPSVVEAFLQVIQSEEAYEQE